MRGSDTLTEFERALVGLVAQGCDYGPISNQLHVSYPAVEQMVRSLEDRFGVTTRAELLEAPRRRKSISGDGVAEDGVPTDQA